MNKFSVVLFGASVLLVGCAGTPPAPDSSLNHPANPDAAMSAVPKLETGLLSLTNPAVAAPSTPQSAMEHDHAHQP
jgi:hypothetical protein